MANKVLTAVLLVSLTTVAADAQGRRPASPTLILDSLTGRDSFDFYCASCHDSTGQGNGPVASSLKTPPSDLTSLAHRNRGTFPRQRIVALLTGAERELAAVHGSSEMPVWGPVFGFLDPSDVRVRLRIENASRTSRRCKPATDSALDIPQSPWLLQVSLGALRAPGTAMRVTTRTEFPPRAA